MFLQSELLQCKEYFNVAALTIANAWYIFPPGTWIGKLALHVFDTVFVSPYVQDFVYSKDTSTFDYPINGSPVSKVTEMPSVIPVVWENDDCWDVDSENEKAIDCNVGVNLLSRVYWAKVLGARSVLVA
jgi:hypothetical protein